MPGNDLPARNSISGKKRQTKKAMKRQHQNMDESVIEGYSSQGKRQRRGERRSTDHVLCPKDRQIY